MDAIVSLLDETHWERLEQIWEELRVRFGLKSGFTTRYPHFSYLSAENIDDGSIDERLSRLALESERLTLRTGGLGFFPGETPVIHLPLVRTAEISRVHRTIWESCMRATDEPRGIFSPDRWIPHITLALDGLTDIDPMEVMGWLATRDLNWTIEVNNFAVITSDGTQRRFDFEPRTPLEKIEVE